MAVNYKTTLRLYVDGVEYDPGFGVFATRLGVVTILGLAGNDSVVSDHIDTQLDYFRVGSSGYGSTEYFSDDFSGTGFTSWDSYSPGSPGTYLTEGSPGVAHLAFTGDLIGNPDIDVTFSIPGDIYWLTAVKTTFPTTATTRSPAYTSWQPGIGTFFIKYYSNAVAISGTVFFCDNSSISPNFVHNVTLNDGNWHTIGLHFHRFEACTPSAGTRYPIFDTRYRTHD